MSSKTQVKTPIQKKSKKAAAAAAQAPKIENRQAPVTRTEGVFVYASVTLVNAVFADLSAFLDLDETDEEPRETRTLKIEMLLPMLDPRCQALLAFAQSDISVVTIEALLRVVSPFSGLFYRGKCETIKKNDFLKFDTEGVDFETFQQPETERVRLNMTDERFGEFFATIPCGPMTKSAGKQ